jgi:hypothetical protein
MIGITRPDHRASLSRLDLFGNNGGVTPAFELSDRSKGFECSEIGRGEIPLFTLALGDCQIMMDFVAASRQD